MASPFISYLTVFKSRLGTLNLVLDQSGFVHQPDAALLRRVRTVLEDAQDLSLDDKVNGPVFQYLKDKSLIARHPRAEARYGAYAGLETVEASLWKAFDAHGNAVRSIRTFKTDIWLSHHGVRSTIGVPTPDNAGEAVELALQLGLLTKSKNTWTSAGHLTTRLRDTFGYLLADGTNPFLLGVEGVMLLRQLVASDGLLIRELVRRLAAAVPARVTRDDIVAIFPEIVEAAVAAGRAAKMSPPSLREAAEFLNLVRRAASGGRRPGRAAMRGSDPAKSRGPGVLEHRVSPRLEWLTDLGYLNKNGIEKNRFEYQTTAALADLLADMDEFVGDDYGSDAVAVSQWRRNPLWNDFSTRVATQSRDESFKAAYNLMRRRIGPVPLREVAIAAALTAREPISFGATLDSLIVFARETEGATLSGGRYRRTPENIYIPSWSRLE